jgi:autotransporter-associated beta strand protein
MRIFTADVKTNNQLNEHQKHMNVRAKLTLLSPGPRILNPINKGILTPRVNHCLGRNLPVSLAFAVVAFFFWAVSAGGQSIGFTADPVATQYGTYADNGGASGGLNIGRTMTVTGAGIEVFQLGVFDFGTNGLAMAHTVTLFSNQTAVASVTVPAGTAAQLINAFRFAPLSTPVFLAAGNYSIVAYQMNGTTTQSSDPYGNGNAPGFSGSGNVTPGAGIYDFVTSGSPAYPGSTSSEEFAAVSLTFTNVLPAANVWTGGGANNYWSTAGNWNGAPNFPADLTFAGSTRLANTNDNTGVTVNSITFDAAAGPFVLSGNDITLGGNISFNAAPATPVTQTINLNMALAANSTIDTPANGNLALNGSIVTGNDIYTVDAGTLTLGGTNSLLDLGVDGGTTVITGDTTINGVQGNGNYDRLYVGEGEHIPGCQGTLIIQPGAVLTITGSFDDTFVIGRDGGSGTVIQNGGTFTFSPDNVSLMLVCATGNSSTRAEYDMNGGVLDMSGNTIVVGFGAGVTTTGIVNQVGGAITNLYNLAFYTPSLPGGSGYGVYTLSGGSIYLGAGGITSSSGTHAINLGGGTVGATTSWASPLNMNLTNLNGSVRFDTAGNTITLSGVLSGNGGLTVAGAGILELSGANTYSGDTTVSAGSTLQLDATGSSLGAFRVVNGSLLNLNFSGNYALAHLYTNGIALPVGTYNAGNLPGFITGSGNLVVSSSISTGLWQGGGANSNWSTAGNWDQNEVPVFPIALTFVGPAGWLTNNNDLPGITASSITFDAAAGAFVLDGNDITLAGSIGFNGNPSTPVTQTVNLNMALSSPEIVDTPANGNLTLGGDLTSSVDTSLIKLDAGALTLGGTNAITSWDLNGGTTTITGNTTIIGDGSGRIYVGDGDYLAECNGTLVIQPGAALNIIGNFADTFVIGRDSGSGTVVQNGGAFTFNPGNNGTIWLGATGNSATRSAYNMNGGLLDMSGNTLGIGLGAGVSITGLVDQVSGVITNVNNLWVGWGNGYGVYTLAGGSIYIGGTGITTTSGNYAVNLGGGTVGATASWTSSLNMNLTNLNGSVAFDTAGNTITLSGVLSGTGGLTVAGGGILELAGANTYTGDTIVNDGNLQLDLAGTSLGAFRLANGGMLNLNYSGTYIVAACYTNGVALPNGVYTSGNLPGFITGGGLLQVAGVVFSSQPRNQAVYLNLGHSTTLTSATVGGSPSYQWYLNGNPVPGATSSNLTLSNLEITNGGNYYVVATSGSGSVTSSVVAVTIFGENNSLFAYEGFQYPSGSSVNGLNGGFGWNGPWVQQWGNDDQIIAGNLVGVSHAPDGYDSRSITNAVNSNGGNDGRFLDCSTNSVLWSNGYIDANGNIGASGKTLYVSFLQEPSQANNYYEFDFERDNLGDGGRIGGIGDDSGNYSGGENHDVNLRVEQPAGGSATGHIIGAADANVVDLYVVRIDYANGGDTVRVYRNPVSATEPPVATLMVSNIVDYSFNGFAMASANGPSMSVDEIRVGATWADAIGLAVSNLLPPTKTAHGYTVQFACTPGSSYRIQRAPAVTGPWTDLTTVVGPANAFVQYNDTSAPAGDVFYRTVTP